MSEEILLTREDGYAILTINRPDKMNAITAPMLFEGFDEALEKVRKDEEIRALIITGAGKAFCSGFDISAFEVLEKPATKWESFELYGDFAMRARSLHKPIIAAVNGAAAGGGLSVALLCDIRIASENAKFTCVWVKRGLMPDMGGSYFLPRIVGLPVAMSMMMTGEVIDAARAEKIGLVSKVVPADKLMETAKEMAASLAKGPPLALGLIKQAAYASMENDLEQQLIMETAGQHRLFLTEDCKEAASSFMEKREPKFKGK